ncbi:MAG TPA: peptidoglycan DD-metalloendopeptidase family protein [Xanthomonadaceae bacterium]|nr:peptidoglycan DD-metalloendopeptidase family protein [Xanthomonadaceae bacterium]
MQRRHDVTGSAARWLPVLALIAVLGACGEAHVVQREPDYAPPTRPTPAPRHAGVGEVEVIRGDTLYGLAFRNGMDFRELAAINGIEAPYTIYVGQILKLRGEHVRALMPTRPIAQAPPHTLHAVLQPVAVAPVTAPTPSVPTPFESQPSEPIPPNSAQAMAPPATQLATPQPISPSPSAAILPADVSTVGGVHWRWPAKGSLLDRFMAGDATRQGIDIAGNAGEAVIAASDGVVVYSGSGLVGYGELIIIKHSDEWLSAYGHNRKRLVQEGQRVKAGQPIAEMGSTGAPRDELHFEIRRNGRPVDPLQYLPSR